ncbi:MAG TPA: SMC family ATPase [Synechococcales cyanobacterium M55_K2018_004]|nr:SMC family ATPase [Synechococcales cyanobacterium M55_K2018_004]
MQILSVTLKNFKSHSDRHFVFQPGTNAICGENGAGKTTILEAIAWVLFNYRGVYRLEDLIRNGAGSAQVRVSFISSRDGRTYDVQRCTTKGYLLFDPQLNAQLEFRHIEAEVLPWLRQHLGVAPGTDLAKLFANTIGVPQGTFTADFLKPPEDRKKVFDAILKVEEYKQVSQEMLSVEKYAKAEEENLQRAIAQFDEMLQEREALLQRHQQLTEEIVTAEAGLAHLQAQIAVLQAEKDHLAAQAQAVQQCETALQTLTTQIEAKQQANELLETSVQRARNAVQICEDNRPSYDAYLNACAVQKELEQQQQKRQQLAKRRDAMEKTLAERQTEMTRLTLQLEALEKAAAELEQLRPLVHQQLELEQQQRSLTQQLQSLQAIQQERQALTRQLSKQQADWQRLSQEIEQLKTLSTVIEQIPELEQRRDRLQEQLSRVEAARQFEADLRSLVAQSRVQANQHQIQAQAALAQLRQMQQTVPLLATDSFDAVLHALQTGMDLNDALLAELQTILADLAEQISAPKLKQQLQAIKQQIDLAYQQRAEFLTLESKGDQLQQLQDDMTQLKQRIAELDDQLAAQPQLKTELEAIATQLTALNNPQGKSQLLQQQLQQEASVRQQQAAIAAQFNDIQQAIAALEAQLTVFADLDARIDEQKQLQRSHHASYLLVLQNQQEAEQLPQRLQDWEAAIAQVKQLADQRSQRQAEYESLRQDYDPQRWHQAEAAYADLKSQADRLLGALPQQRKLQQELTSRLESLQEIAAKRDRAQTDLKRHEKVRRFITFARRAYKEAGPRITERYVQRISCEADRLFRELMNRSNLALEWTRDYEILVQEGAHLRRFINLSGGEQMCAALSVRLALLRVLADIDVAFFDEPTTNMDRPRRESLAEAIANLKSFRQLFVISHDDTFEKVTENVIVVEREL